MSDEEYDHDAFFRRMDMEDNAVWLLMHAAIGGWAWMIFEGDVPLGFTVAFVVIVVWILARAGQYVIVPDGDGVRVEDRR